MINVNPNFQDDPFYRYKMAELKLVPLGKNSNFETKLDNLDDISKALCRDSGHIFKYITQNIKTASITKNGTYVLKGKYETKQLQPLIFKFIKEFVLCKECTNPETEFIKDKKILNMKCKSCGKLFQCQGDMKISKLILDKL
jgi:translation initiation factor 5